VSHLVAIAYPDRQQASEAMGALKRLDAAGTIEIQEAVVVEKDHEGGIKPEEVFRHAATGAGMGLFLGALVGLVFFPPLAAVGAVYGAVGGALTGKLVSVGLADNLEDFARQVNDSMPPGSWAILMLVRKRDPDAAIAELGRYGGSVLRTSLPDEVEDQLRITLGQPTGAA
jgi:uncharacterized membrane protein